MRQIEAALADEDLAFLRCVRQFLDAELSTELIAEVDAQRMFFGD